MNHTAILSAVALWSLSLTPAFGDSSPELAPEPKEAVPVEVSAEPAAPAPAVAVIPVRAAAPVQKSDSASVTPIARVVVSPEGSREAARASDLSVSEPDAVARRPVAGKITRQYHSSYYVNRVRLMMPAGIRVTVRKDWYSDEVILVYSANPYTSWRDITPESFVFRHKGTTLEVHGSGTKYVPAEVTLYVPSAIRVETP